MKKILFVFLLLFELTVQAQVQRNFWGLELGRSTRSEVKSFLSSSNLQFEDNFSGLDAIDVTDLKELPLGGYSWSVTFMFYNNILCYINLLRTSIGFSMTTAETYEIDTKHIFHDLRGKLNNKYGTLEDPLGQSQNHYVRRDLQTVVELELNNGDVILRYYDRKLARASVKGNDL